MWMFLFLGVVTFFWGFVILSFLPDSISDASFLTEEEKFFVSRRTVIAGTGRTEGTKYNRNQAIECLFDPKTWHLVGIVISTQIPNGGIQNFANLVVKSFGFTALESALINIPVSLIGAATITLTGWLAGRFKNLNCILIACVLAISGTGSVLIRVSARRPVQLVGYFLLATGPGALPLTMSLAQTNYKGVTKKMTMTGLMFVAYCLGNIAGPHIFSAEAASYEASFGTILVCDALAVALALSLYFYLRRVNLRRECEETDIPAARSETGNSEESPLLHPGQDRFDDATDWNTFGFRYRC
jgi:hypothetical protein